MTFTLSSCSGFQRAFEKDLGPRSYKYALYEIKIKDHRTYELTGEIQDKETERSDFTSDLAAV